MIWKEKSCEKCVFRDEDMCKRFPQNVTVPGVSEASWYPQILLDDGQYQDACAEYAESLDHSCPKCGHGMITSPEHPSRYCTKCGEGF